VFPDGEIETNYKETIYSSYFWDLHRNYPKVPLLKEHHVQSVLNGRSITTQTHTQLLTKIHRDLITVYGFTTPETIWPISQLIYKIVNDLYNALSYRIEKYVNSIDILDFLNITEDPTIADVLSTGTPTGESIRHIKAVISQSLNKDLALKENPIARSVSANTVKFAQVFQCIGPRGFLQDIDSTIFPIPVMRSYFHGIDKLHDSLIESRSAARSLFFAKGQLEDSEYFARRLQLQTMVVESVHKGDCGSTDYLSWNIRENDLKHMVGKYYVDEETQSLKVLKATDFHLVGKSIRIRSVVAGCKHPDPHGICSVCFGEMTLNVLANTNLGHNCSTTMTHQTTQGVLSTKHLEQSANNGIISFSDIAKEFLLLKTKTLDVYLKPIHVNSLYEMVISQKDALGILDIQTISNLDSLNLTRISNLGIIEMRYDDKSSISSFPVHLTHKNSNPCFTKEFLSYIQKNGWTVDNRNNFVIDLKDWTFAQPVFRYPMKDISMGDHSKTVANLIESTIKDIGERIKPESPINLLSELFDIVNEKMNINIAILEVIVYGSMVRSLENNDFRLPKSGTPRSLSVTSLNIENRSLSAELGYKEQFDSIRNPISFFKGTRIDHTMDCFIKPYEVGEYYHWNDKK
jgi:hypothetical protein